MNAFRKFTCLTASAVYWLGSNSAYAFTARSADSMFDQQQFTSEVIESVNAGLYHPFVSLVLYASLALSVVGMIFRSKNLIGYPLFVAAVIGVLRAFGHYIFGSYTLFKTTIILPLFFVTLGARLFSSYMKKRREAKLEEAQERASRSKRLREDRYKDREQGRERLDETERHRSVYKSTSLRPEADAPVGIGAAAQAAPVKLTRGF